MTELNKTEYVRRESEWYGFELSEKQVQDFEKIDPDFRLRNNIVETWEAVYELVLPVQAADTATVNSLTGIIHAKIVKLLVTARVPVSDYGNNPYIYSFPEFKAILT